MSDDDNAYMSSRPRRNHIVANGKRVGEEFGLTETEMARHLMEQDRLRKAGQIQAEGENS